MSLFNKKKKLAQKHSLSSKVIRSLNYVPVDYTYTRDFLLSSDENLEESRRLLKNVSPDELCADMADPFIDSRVRSEQVEGKEQFTKNVTTVYHLTEEAMTEGARAKLLDEKLTRLMEENEKRQEELLALCQNKTFGGIF